MNPFGINRTRPPLWGDELIRTLVWEFASAQAFQCEKRGGSFPRGASQLSAEKKKKLAFLGNMIGARTIRRTW